MSWEHQALDRMVRNQESKPINQAVTLAVEQFPLVKVVLSVDMIRLSANDNLKSTNSYSHQLNKSLVWWKTKILKIIKQQTTDTPKPNIISRSPKKKTAANNQKQLINKTLVLSFRFLQIRQFQATWFRIQGQLMSKISISRIIRRKNAKFNSSIFQ